MFKFLLATTITIQVLDSKKKGKDPQQTNETDGKSNLNYNLTFKIVTNKLSFSIPRAIFIRLSNYTTILIYSPILAAVLGKVIQETFAS